MKKLLLLSIVLITLNLRGQDVKPAGTDFKNLPTFSFSYYTHDSSVWIYKGSTYGWTKLVSKRHLNYVIDSLNAISADVLSEYRKLNNHDSIASLENVVINTPLVDQVLKYNGVNWINGNEVSVNAGSGVDFFYVETASDIGGYSSLSRSPDSGGELDETVVANNNRVLINEYASLALGGTKIDAGIWTFDTWAYVDVSLSGSSSIEIDIIKRTSGGTETLLFTVNSGSLMTSVGSTPYVTTTVQGEYAINSTDRLVAKVYGKNTASVNRTIHFFHGGTSHYSHFNTPLVIRHDDLAGISGNGTVHLSSAEVTAITHSNRSALDLVQNTNTGDNATNTTSNTYADGKVADTINDGTTTIAPSQNAVYDALALKISTSQKGSANGVAELDATGKIPAAQLPSFVDDVLEYATFNDLPVTGEGGKIYVTLDDYRTYRWSGSVYTEISSSLALGETSTTAYRGDRGKTAYDHSQASHQSIINGTGFVKATGTTLSYDNSTYLTSEVDGSTSNEIQDISTNGNPGNIAISSGSTLNLNVNDADANSSNEIQDLSGSGNTISLSSDVSGVELKTVNSNSLIGSGNISVEPAGTALSVMGTHESSYTHGNIANGQTAFGWGNWASNFGTGAGQIAQGNDSRINNGQSAYTGLNFANLTTNYLPKYSTTLVNSLISDDGTNVRIKNGTAGFNFYAGGQVFGTTFGNGGNLTLCVTESGGTITGPSIFIGGSTRSDGLKNAIAFSNGTTEYARIDGDYSGHTLGSFLLGYDTNPGSYKIAVNGNAYIGGAVTATGAITAPSATITSGDITFDSYDKGIYLNRYAFGARSALVSDVSSNIVIGNSTDWNAVKILRNTDITGNLTTTGSGTFTGGGFNSSRKLKDLYPDWNKSALKAINQFKLRDFSYKTDSGANRTLGFIIDEIPNSVKEYVVREGDAVNLYTLHGLSFKAIQELNKENENLKKENEDLENRLEKLERIVKKIERRIR